MERNYHIWGGNHRLPDSRAFFPLGGAVMICGHEFKKGISCEKINGHPGLHFHSETLPDGISFYRWNDNGETENHQVELMREFTTPQNAPDGEKEKAVESAIKDAMEALQSDDVFEIRAKLDPSERWPNDSFNDLRWGCCWYYVDSPKQPEGFKNSIRPTTGILFRRPVSEGIVSNACGYVLVARIKA